MLPNGICLITFWLFLERKEQNLRFDEKEYLKKECPIIEKIAKKIGDREAMIEIGIANHFSNGDRDRDRDRDLNF